MSNIKQVINLIYKDLQLDHLPSIILEEKNSDIEQEDLLRLELCKILENLLQNNFSKLLQLMYRVDIPEEHLEATLKTKNIIHLADLIIEREKKKIFWREKYRRRRTNSY